MFICFHHRDHIVMNIFTSHFKRAGKISELSWQLGSPPTQGPSCSPPLNPHSATGLSVRIPSTSWEFPVPWVSRLKESECRPKGSTPTQPA